MKQGKESKVNFLYREEPDDVERGIVGHTGRQANNGMEGSEEPSQHDVPDTELNTERVFSGLRRCATR